MKLEIKLAIEVLEAAGHTVMLKKNPEPKKFVPFKGQIVRTAINHYVFMFTRMDKDMFVSNNGDSYTNCEPIPNVVQFQPISELDPAYDGPINILYANGRITSHWRYAICVLKLDWAPVGFQKLEKLLCEY